MLYSLEMGAWGDGQRERERERDKQAQRENERGREKSPYSLSSIRLG